jgi:hypothetical protein
LNDPSFILDEGVHDALGVHDDADPFGRNVEEPARLDDLEPLVHEGRRIDRDLRPHRPVRMPERLLGRRLRERVVRPRPEWSARGGEPERADLRRILAPKTLVDRAVLAVHGEDRGTGLAGARHDEGTADDESLLVGEGDVLPASTAAKVGRTPAAPTRPLTTMSAAG